MRLTLRRLPIGPTHVPLLLLVLVPLLVPLLVLVPLVVPLPLLPAAALAGTTVVRDGVPHVMNDATPARGIVTRQLEELWRLGGADDETVLIGRIDDACAGPGGSILLLDAQLAHILVMSPGGELVRTIGGPGEGPGEVRRPIGIVRLPDDTIGILQPHPSKIERLALDGTPAGGTRFGDGLAMVFAARSNGRDLMVAGVRVNQDSGGQDRDSFLARFDDEGQEELLFLEHHYRFDFEDFVMDEKRQYFPYWRFAIDDAGRVYYAAERNRYAITVVGRDGTIERVIERAYTSRRRTPDEMKRVEAQFDSNARNVPFPVRKVIAETPADVASLHVAGDGSLWVLTSRGTTDQPAGVLRTFDVFDAAGHFDRRLALAAPDLEDADPGRDAFFIVDDEHFIRVTRSGQDDEGDGEGETEAATPEIICYALR